MSTSTGMASQSQSGKKTAEAASSSSEPVSTAEQTASSASSATGLITNTTNSTNLNLHENFNTSANISLIGGLPSATAGESNNTSAAVSTDNYTVSMMSGDEFLLPRKAVLTEVIIEHLRGVRERENVASKDAEACESEMATWADDVEIHDAEVAKAEKVQREAAERVRRATAELDAAKKEHQELAAKLEDLKQTEAEIAAEVASVEEVLESAKNAASADFVKELIGKLQENSDEETHGGLEKTGESERVRENRDGSSSKAQDKPLAGKRQREEAEHKLAADNTDANEEEHRRKEAKWEDSELEGSGNRLSGVAEVDADLGLVFNSPGKDPAEFTLGDANQNVDNTNSANEFTFPASVVRLHAYRVLSEHRSEQGLSSLPDVMDLIFCVHRVTGEVFSDVDGDTPVIPESVLTAGDLVVGVRTIPALDFDVIMRPFRVLSRCGFMCGNQHDLAAPEKVTDPGSNEQSTNRNDAKGKQKEWWEVTNHVGQPVCDSERTAIDHVASVLCGRFPGRGYQHLLLIAPFFRQHWPEWHELVASQQKDLKFALAEMKPFENHFYWQPNVSSCMLPTEAAIKIAKFQLQDSDKEGAEAMTRLFPPFIAQLVAGLRLQCQHAAPGCQSGLTEFLRFFADLSGRVPALLSHSGPWSWPPNDDRLRSDGIVSVRMPLLRPFIEEDLSVGHLMILDLFRYARIEAARDPSVDPKLTLHWQLKQCLVEGICEDEDEWEKKLAARELDLQQQMKGGRDANSIFAMPRAQVKADLALLEAVRKIEGTRVRPEKKLRLGKETVLQLDI